MYVSLTCPMDLSEIGEIILNISYVKKSEMLFSYQANQNIEIGISKLSILHELNVAEINGETTLTRR